MPPRKRVLAVVKIQLEAGSATPARRWNGAGTPRRPDDGVLQAVQRGDREPTWHGHPRRYHHLRGPHLLVRAQDVADAGAAPPGGGHPKGSATTSREQVGTITEAQLADIAR